MGMENIPNFGVYSILIFFLTSCIASIIGPSIVEKLKEGRTKKEKYIDLEISYEEKEHEFELKALRLEHEMESIKDKVRRLTSKIRIAIKFVRAKDPALEFILTDLEGEMDLLDLEEDLK